jgi:VWFA-related protein
VLWNGVFFAARLKLQAQSGRKAMLLLTDGWDTGSDHRLTEAIQACQAADATIYSIRYVDPALLLPNTIQKLKPSTERGIKRRMERIFAVAKRDLQRISHETGGKTFEGESANLPAVFNEIETAIRSEYVLGFIDPAAGQRNSYHKIKVRVKRPGLVVRARDGYSSQ